MKTEDKEVSLLCRIAEFSEEKANFLGGKKMEIQGKKLNKRNFERKNDKKAEFLQNSKKAKIRQMPEKSHPCLQI